MAQRVGIHEAKTHLSRLVRRVQAGEGFEIVKHGVPVARLVPVRPSRPRRLGLDDGLFAVPEDFNQPLPDALRPGGA